MQKILYIIPYLSIGGTEKHLLDLIQGFSKDYELFLLAPPGETLEKFLTEPIKYYSFPRLDQNLFSGLKSFISNLKKIINENSIDLIHIHGAPELMLLVRLVTRKIPIIFTVHGFHGELKNFDYWLCTRFCNSLANQVIFVSKSEEKILTKNKIKVPTTTILNGVPDYYHQNFIQPFELQNINPQTIIIGAIARLETTKGINFLIDAFANLIKTNSNLVLIIVGTGSKQHELELKVKELHLTEQIIFTGYQSEVNAFLKYFSIFAIPSLHEAHPLVLMEAMSHAKPIIATQVGGIPEVINHLDNGLLVPPANVEALKEKLILLINDLELQKKLGLNARKTYETNYTVTRMLKETGNLYQTVIQNKS